MIDIKKAEKKFYEDLGGCMMNFLYVIQKPCSMVKWFTTNPDIAGYAICEGWSVKRIKEKCKIKGLNTSAY